MNFKSFWNKCPAGNRRSRWKPCTGFLCCISIWGKQIKLKAEDPVVHIWQFVTNVSHIPNQHAITDTTMNFWRIAPTCSNQQATSAKVREPQVHRRPADRQTSEIGWWAQGKRVEVTSKVGKHKFVFHLVTEKVEVKINRDSLTNNVLILVVTLTRSGTCLVISTHQ